MVTAGSKERIAYLEAKKRYLEVGKRYSLLLANAMNLDGNILKIADQILSKGDRLSLYDNSFLTAFYKELKSKSRIDKKYYDILLEIKKTKNELDHSVSALSAARVKYLLRKAGIPPKKTNHNADTIAAQVNDPSLGLLEKITLPGVLEISLSEELDDFVVRDEIACVDGVMLGKTKEAKELIRRLEKETREKINNDYLLKNNVDLVKTIGKLDRSNILRFIRATADKEHAREIERRIDAGDVYLKSGALLPKTEKGKKYISLLIEELTASYEKKLKEALLNKNKTVSMNDPRVTLVTEAINDMDISLKKHHHITSLAPNSDVLKGLVENYTSKKSYLEEILAEAMTIQETISASFVNIKKQLLSVLNKKEMEVESLLSLILAVKYLSIYELKYEKKLDSLESLLGIYKKENARPIGPASLNQIVEDYNIDGSEGEIQQIVGGMVVDILGRRQAIGKDTNETLINFLLGSPQTKELSRVALMESGARKYIVDTLYNEECLYKGLNNISEILAELAELEVEKKEVLADLAHEIDLAHKELWLSKISNSHRKYVETIYTDIPTESRARAIKESCSAVENARSEILSTMERYRKLHKKHSEDFGKLLRDSLSSIVDGGDVMALAKRLKDSYKELQTQHRKQIDSLEKEILLLEKRLAAFEDSGPRTLDKILLSDIRAKI